MLTPIPFLALIFTKQAAPPVPRPPHFIGSSESIVNGMFRALQSLDSQVITVKNDEGVTRIEVLGKRIHETQPSVEWSFDGKTVYIRDRVKHTFTSGRCKRHRAIDAVAIFTGHRVDLMSKALLLQRAPLSEVFVDAQVRIAGFVAPNNVPCDIVRADAGGARATVFVRRKDGLPASITSETMLDNQVVSSAYRSFGFGRLTSPTFALTQRPAEKVVKFPTLPKEKGTVYRYSG